MNPALNVDEKNFEFQKEKIFGPLPTFSIFKNDILFIYFWNQREKHFYTIHSLRACDYSVKKSHFAHFGRLKPWKFSEILTFFQIFLYILNKGAKFFRLIYNSCRFVKKFQTDNTLSDKIAILTIFFELTLWRPRKRYHWKEKRAFAFELYFNIITKLIWFTKFKVPKNCRAFC